MDNSNNNRFEDLVDEFNKKAQQLGFQNGKAWADRAMEIGEIQKFDHDKVKDKLDIRVKYSHGNASDISVSEETIEYMKRMLRFLESHTNIRPGDKGGYHHPNLPEGTFRGGKAKKYYGGQPTKPSNGQKRRQQPSRPMLPEGTFRSYVKEFQWNGTQGRSYSFRFRIVEEVNWIDDGNGGRNDQGFFIHIEKAPCFDLVKEQENYLHHFHMIETNDDYHICWNKPIENFQEANAVMFVWLKHYVTQLEGILDNGEPAYVQGTQILPTGTFRASDNEKIQNQKLKLLFTEDVFEEIENKIGKNTPELGGMLGSHDGMVIDTFQFDVKGSVSRAAYSPDTNSLNKVLRQWDEKGIRLVGFVHSHPASYRRLSGDYGGKNDGDIAYATGIMKAFGLSHFFMPLVMSVADNKKFEIIPYIVNNDGSMYSTTYSVVKEETAKSIEADFDPEVIKEIESGFAQMDANFAAKTKEVGKINVGKETPKVLDQDHIFARIESVLPLDLLKKCTIVGIGCGGALEYYQDMARMGVGRFVLIDGDKASKSNVASQGVYLHEVGKFKPENGKERILDTNPDAIVEACDFMLDDKIDDQWVEDHVIKRAEGPILICGFADSFAAQARGARIAEKYGLPYLSGQHYQGGVISEVVYVMPGESPYREKDILKSRYSSYQQGYVNKTTSVGSPICNSNELNVLCEKISLGLLLIKDRPDSPFVSFLTSEKRKQLILIREMDVSMSELPCVSFFAAKCDAPFGDCLWLDPMWIGAVATNVPASIKDSREIFKD
jgi:hypothetical protein